MSDIEGKAAREVVSECGQRASFNAANGMNDIEGSEPDWRSCEGNSERVWAKSAFQLRNRAGTLHQRVRRERVVQNFPGGFDSRYWQSCGIQEAKLDQD